MDYKIAAGIHSKSHADINSSSDNFTFWLARLQRQILHKNSVLRPPKGLQGSTQKARPFGKLKNARVEYSTNRGHHRLIQPTVQASVCAIEATSLVLSH